MPVDSSVNPARALAGALEPVIGSVYFAPECHRAYAALGFAPSANKAGQVELPDGPAYFTSRGSAMGQVPGEVVAAAFGVFNPAAVIPAVAHGWTLTDAATIATARTEGTIALLHRLIGPSPEGLDFAVAILRRAVEPLRPEGRPLFAGLLSLGLPDDAVGTMWRLGDCLREFRGDSHTAAWISAGLTAVEIGLLTELFLGLPMHTYIRTRAWSDDQVAAGIDGLRSRGLIGEGGFTDEGRALRSAIEDATDAQMGAALAAIGDDHERLVALLAGWSATVRAGHGYLAGGANDLARSSG